MIITTISEYGSSSTQIHFYRTKELLSSRNDFWHLGRGHIFLNVFLDATKDFSKLGQDFKHLTLGKVQALQVVRWPVVSTQPERSWR